MWIKVVLDQNGFGLKWFWINMVFDHCGFGFKWFGIKMAAERHAVAFSCSCVLLWCRATMDTAKAAAQFNFVHNVSVMVTISSKSFKLSFGRTWISQILAHVV